MVVSVLLCLGLAVLAAWIATLALWRLVTPLERLHAVTFVNVAGGAGLVLAAWLTDGASPRALKCTAIWLATLLIGALLSHVTGHALHIRDGERR
ncbi:cation:proton antiporter [Methylobacterium nonmethylotrophicum]|uniref:Cation:proton antiporter n=1 Tax=Methylobacterium nonmethylotrophicum TaxID=1141884 RepID=A0A4Z0NYY4_9HYPH|nr:cation:proton antiporter [Methylobacterium nonmethylotrophicum]